MSLAPTRSRVLLLLALAVSLAGCSVGRGGAETDAFPDWPDYAIDGGAGAALDGTSDVGADAVGLSDAAAAADGATGDRGPTGAGPLRINEVVARGPGDDWVELVNLSDAPVSLLGLALTDDPKDTPRKYVLDAAALGGVETLEPGGYRTFTLTSETAGFGLGSEESLALVAVDGAPIDGVSWDKSTMREGWSLGREPDGGGAFAPLMTATPGAPNKPNPPCGDGAVEAKEVCDGAPPPGQSCKDYGFASGSLGCATDCLAVETSGCSDAPPVSVVLNEVESEGDDRIELVAIGGSAGESFDLGGWSVNDDGYDPAQPEKTAQHRHVLAAGTLLQAGARLVLVKGKDHGFGLGKADRVELRDPAGVLRDATTWQDGDANPSWCRVPDGSGPFQSCAASSFGAAN